MRMSEDSAFFAGYRERLTPVASSYVPHFTHLFWDSGEATTAANAKLVAECPDGKDLPPPQNFPVLFGV